MTRRSVISKPGTSAAAAAWRSRAAAFCGVSLVTSAPNTLVSLCTSTGLTSSSSSRTSSKSSYLARRGGLEEQLVPAGHAEGQVAGPDAALLEQLAGLAMEIGRA